MLPGSRWRLAALIISIAGVCITLLFLLPDTPSVARGPLQVSSNSDVTPVRSENRDQTVELNIRVDAEETRGREDASSPRQASAEESAVNSNGALPGGLVDDQRNSLLVAQQAFYDTPPGSSQKDLAALGYVTRSVATILQARGRSELLNAQSLHEQRENKSSSRPTDNNEWFFLCDGARFTFRRGEFPGYDSVRDRIATSVGLPASGHDASSVHTANTSSPEEFPEELALDLDVLAAEALSCFVGAK